LFYQPSLNRTLLLSRLGGTTWTHWGVHSMAGATAIKTNVRTTQQP
jgi:hypothetical protein